VALSATAAGYVLIGADGGTFTFGDAQFHGSIPGVLPGVALASGIVGLVPGPAGYLMLGGDGGIFNFGQSRFHGSLAGFDAPGVVAVAVLSDLSGYLMLDTSGTVWPFGDTRGVGVETSNGAGPASVAFDHDGAVIVEVSVSTAGSSSFFYEGLGQPIEVPSPGVARVVVDAPELAAIDIDTTGIWTMRVLPLSYATHWRKGGDPVSAEGSDVYRIDRTPAGTRLEFVSDGYIAVSARAVDGSDARLLYNGGGHMGDQTVTDAVTLPLVGGPMIVAVQSNFAHTVELSDPVLPRSVEVVGDSVGITLVINSPSSLDGVLSLRDSAIEGCGIIDSGSMISGGRTRRNFSACVNFAQRWAADVAAHRPDVVLVVIGAWEVFDLSIDGVVVPFGSEAHDEVLRNGLERVRAAFEPLDTSVALLEVPCQFPRPGGGLTPLPERGERWRTDHLNELLAEIAATDDQFNDRMKLVTSPPALCDDPSIADNPSIRWDGTHYGPAGGALVWSHLRDQLLRMP
ncbi:MAG: hypothetical protein KDB16_18845, partial [Acidimicrobiales bacterium]|nr:hypothetical protein [Acidimicrobiales bacterium]